jgi:hypothetical protein
MAGKADNQVQHIAGSDLGTESANFAREAHMRVYSVKSRPLWLLLTSTALLAAAAPAQGQFKLFRGPRPDSCSQPPCPAPPLPQPAPAPLPPPSEAKPPTTPTPPPPPIEPSISPEAAAATGTGAVALAIPSFKGDQVPIVAIAFGPPQQPSSQQPRAGIVAPPARTFKISDDESPQPRDRVFVDFNYYDNVGAAVARRLSIDMHDVAIYRESFGLEKTFLNNNASLGLRVPLNTLSSDSNTPGQSGTDTDIGDLTAILKYAFWRDPAYGTLLSTGLAVTAPTGPGHFAGSSIPTTRETSLQPFLGYIWTNDRWFVHGFTSIAVATGSNDVTSLFNSFGVGYMWARGEGRLLTGIAPTLEVHVSDPLNHRGAFKLLDPVGTADVVDLTMATTFNLGQRSSLSAGVVTPVTGPKPFDVEALVQFNWFFGARRNRSLVSAGVVGD